MARKRERIFAIVVVILFFATSFGISFAVLYQMYQDSHQKKGNSVTTQQPTLQGTKLTNFTPVSSVDKLQIIDQKQGNGTEAKAGDTVVVDYTGAIASSGVVFQSSLDTGQPVSLSLSQVIKGWQDGIPGMKVGGTRRLLIPAADAYGANPPQGSGIPANAPLVFDITLQSVGK
jgi:FKBP-type peptidyl-prolyl cis-trans isomerase